MRNWTTLNLFLVVYEHRHGDDVYLLSSREEAEQARVDIAREWAHEFTEESLTESELEDAAADWSEFTAGNEHIGILEAQVDVIHVVRGWAKQRAETLRLWLRRKLRR